MKYILLLCNMGMSTSMLARKMQSEADAQGLDAKVEALSLTEGMDKIDSVDVILLGPQVRFNLDAIKEAVAGKVPVDVVDMTDYGTMNGANVLKQALDLIQE